MKYITVAQAAEQWGISDRRVRILCQQGKIDGVIRKGRAWMIPAGAEKPIDGRTTRYQRNDSPYGALFAEVDALKAELDKRRPLTQGELQRLRDESHRFAVTFHRDLRRKRLETSLLDDIPGIGKSRKLSLLREFGSVRKIKDAGPVEIARRVPGIGENFAEKIYEYLVSH